MKYKYNLQFFAEDDKTEEPNGGEPTLMEPKVEEDKAELNIDALAGIISEQDKRIQQLEQDNENLKKTNAQLLVRVSATSSPAQPKKTFDENLLDMVGYKPRKE